MPRPLVAGIVAAASTLFCAPTIAAITAEQLDALARDTRAQVIAWRRDIHQHPELGNREFRTSEIVATQLESLGLKVERKIAHTGVVALLEGGKPGPRVALREDMDALPVTEQADVAFKSTVTAEFRGEKVGVMHACGHDVHTSVLMGVATALAAVKQDLSGSVLFVFQPAEEGPPDGEDGGAEVMLKEGVFERYHPDIVLGLHVWSTLPVGTLGVREGAEMAESDKFRIMVKGRQTHGARPWGGIDPIVVSAQIVNALQTIVSRRVDLTTAPAVVSVGSIKGGIRYNIVPEDVEMMGTIRSFDDPMREQIYADLKRIVEHTAAAAGATATVEISRHTRVLKNDPALTARVRASLQRVAGTDKVVEMPLVTAAEDFSFFAEQVPGVYFFVGSTPLGQDPATAPSNHSPKYFVDEGAIDVALRSLLHATVDYLQSAPMK